LLKTQEHVTVVAAAPPHKHRFSDLRSPRLLARYPGIGVLMFVLGALAFGVLAVNVQNPNSPLVQADTQIVNQLHALALHSPPFILTAMIAGYYLGEQVLVVIGVLITLYFLVKRYWPELIMVLLGWGGETALVYVLSTYFNRPRPEFPDPVWQQMTMIQPTFPSGHVFGAVMGFGLLAYLAAPRMKTAFGRFVVVAAALGLCLYIGFSRVFLGHHYPSDILAGIALGIAWSGLVYTTVELLAFRKKQRPGERSYG
jgi:membrane-associated phospholipid phosphatase